MSKYIRTKDGIYEPDGESFDKLYFLVKVKGGWNYLSKKESILKEADTIEELCDRFVYKRTLSAGKVIYETFERLDREHHADDEFCRLIEYRGDYYPDRQGIALEQVKNGVYGAIWTDEGLIYKAKMNEKGDLELL